MTAAIPQAPFPLAQGKGAAYVHTTIIGQRCLDEGVEISCERCGHTFVPSKPLSDESQPADNIELAAALWFHQCANEGAKAREVERRARIANRRR